VASPAEYLLNKIATSQRWPLREEERIHEELSLWRAFREGNRERLAKEVGWREDRPYLLDPLAERIPETWADLLFGDDPKIEPAKEADAQLEENIVEGNDLPSGLQDAEEICASEGEVFWRVYKDDTVLDVPTIEWCSRLDTIPYFLGRKIAAVAFVSVVWCEEHEEGKDTLYRYVAVYEEGRVLNRLFRGEDKSLGALIKLADRPETKDLQDEWNHQLPALLAGRVVNKRAPRNRSRSVYHGIKDFLLALNENLAIGQENARLSGKKRAVIPPDMLDPEGNFPADTDVWIKPTTDQDPDDKTGGLIQIEWNFDASSLKLWVDHLEEQAVTRSRIAPQLIGKSTENALTGPALRARLFDTVLATQGKGRVWDDELPQALTAAQMVDNLAEDQGGFGHPWSSPTERPSVERGDALPVDEDDEVSRIAQEISSEILSHETALRERHPDWSDTQILDELKKIKADLTEFSPPVPPFVAPGVQ
jgi:hypothetical protein